jgi:hypothetical protein
LRWCGRGVVPADAVVIKVPVIKKYSILFLKLTINLAAAKNSLQNSKPSSPWPEPPRLLIGGWDEKFYRGFRDHEIIPTDTRPKAEALLGGKAVGNFAKFWPR